MDHVMDRQAESSTGTRERLLDAALHVIRERGYGAASVDEVCRAAGVTKGSFFHHFKSKEDMAVAAAAHFSDFARSIFDAAPYRSLDDPLDRVMGYLDFRASILRGDLPEFTCFLGTMVQEAYRTHPAIREACERGIFGHAAEIAKDIEEAKRKYASDAQWSAEGLAHHTQAVLQGAFILAKARGGPDVAIECVRHLQRYFELLFSPPTG
jgi:TetR/AcrR family transcriptional repressor of nem operon